MTWDELESLVRERLLGDVDGASVEARWIVERVSGSRDEPVRGGELAPPAAVFHGLEMAERRVGGEPLQYVLGEWSFREFDVLVDPRVLVPRPETEVTAEVAITEGARLGLRLGRTDPWAGDGGAAPVVDLGTGSGVLALALGFAFADVEVWGTDVRGEALAVARANVAGAGSVATRIRLVAGCWFDALPEDLRGRIVLVVSNPPYVSEVELAQLPAVVADHEPHDALVSGPTGLEAIEAIVRAAPRWLAPRSALVVELAPHQADAATALALEAGFSEAFVRADLAGRPRVLVARLS